MRQHYEYNTMTLSFGNDEKYTFPARLELQDAKAVEAKMPKATTVTMNIVMPPGTSFPYPFNVPNPAAERDLDGAWLWS